MVRRFALAACAWALLGAATPEGAPAAATPPPVDLSRIRLQGATLVAPSGRGAAELTLAPDLDREADRLLEDAPPAAGAIVAVDLRNGHLLVWAERRRDGRG